MKTICAAVEGHIKRCKRVLVCAPTNEAVNALVRTWEDFADKKFHFGRWAVFRSAYLNKSLNAQPSASQPGRMDDQNAADSHWNPPSSKAARSSAEDWTKRGLAHRCWQLAKLTTEHPSSPGFDDAKRYLELLGVHNCDMSSEDRAQLRFLGDDFQRMILEETKVIFSTTSMSCHPVLMEYFPAEVVVVDEADAATTPDLVTPLAAFKNSVEVAVLSGGQKQRSPVVFSRGPNEAYNALKRSLFEVLADEDRPTSLSDQRYPVCRLST